MFDHGDEVAQMFDADIARSRIVAARFHFHIDLCRRKHLLQMKTLRIIPADKPVVGMRRGGSRRVARTGMKQEAAVKYELLNIS